MTTVRKRTSRAKPTISYDDSPSDGHASGARAGDDGSSATGTGSSPAGNSDDGPGVGFGGSSGPGSTDFFSELSGIGDRNNGDDIPLGTGKADKRGGGEESSARGKRGRGDSGSNTGTGKTETRESSAGSSIPRDVKFGALGGHTSAKQTSKNAEITTEFLSESWGLLFHGLAIVFRDAEWKLPEDDAQELAERTQRWMAAGGMRRLQTIEKLIAKYQPTFSVLIAFLAVIIPRVVHTSQMRKQKRAEHSPTSRQGAGAGGIGSSSVDTSTEGNPGPVGQAPPVRTAGEAWPGSNQATVRPLRRQDWSDFPA